MAEAAINGSAPNSLYAAAVSQASRQWVASSAHHALSPHAQSTLPPPPSYYAAKPGYTGTTALLSPAGHGGDVRGDGGLTINPGMIVAGSAEEGYYMDSLNHEGSGGLGSGGLGSGGRTPGRGGYAATAGHM